MPEHTPTLPLLIDHPFGQVRTRSDISEALQSAIDSALPRKNSPPFAVTRSTTAFKKLGCGPPLFPDTRARIPIINDVPNHALTLSLSVHVPRISGFRRQPSQSRPFILGNLFLSSCPGKKGLILRVLYLFILVNALAQFGYRDLLKVEAAYVEILRATLRELKT